MKSPLFRTGLVPSLVLSTAIALAGTADLQAAQCNGGGFTDPGNGAPNLPPLNMPFDLGEDWIVGGNGSFFGNGWHCNQNNDYYATDWNRSGGGTSGKAVYPVAAGVVKESFCSNGDGYGCRVVIEHQLGGDDHRFRSLYAHLQNASQSHIVAGDVVMPWTRIGNVGNTGQPGMAAHLHLGFKSYHNGGWYSKCNDPKPGSSLCWSSEAPQAPQSHKPRWMWRDLTGETIQRDAVNDYDTISSGNRPRIFLPGFRKNGSWDTNIYVRNNHSGAQTVRVRIYDTNGVLRYQANKTVNANGSWEISPSSSQVGGGLSYGTAVVLGDSGKDLAATARVQRNNSSTGRAYAAFEGVEQPMVEQQVSVFHKNNYGWNSRVFLFNPDATSSVRAQLKLRTSSTSCTLSSVTVGPMRTKEINASSLSVPSGCLPQNFGSLSVEADYSSTGDPALLALTAYQEHIVGGQYDSLAVVATRDTGKTLYVPLIQNNNYNIQAGLGVQAATGNGELRAYYYRETGGSHCAYDRFFSWPVVQTPVPLSSSSLACPTVLSAKLTPMGSANYLQGQFNQLLNNESSSFPAVAHPTWKAYLPYLDKTAGIAHGLQIQNTSSAGISGTIRFYNDAGSQVGSRSLSIPSRGFTTLVGSSQIPSSARNAKIEMNGNIAVIVNNVMPSGPEDPIMTYTAPGRF